MTEEDVGLNGRTAVAVSRCRSYDEAEVERALAAAAAPFGGFAGFVKPGDSVCLKVNLLRGSAPEQAVTTHPAVVRATARAVAAAGGEPFLADSPGSGLPHAARTFEKAYRRSGYAGLAGDFGLALNYDESSETVHFDDGVVAKVFPVMTPVLAADVVINLCKLKTHAFTIFTGAVKNLFGVIPGFEKPAYHARLREVDHFAGMLLDVARFVNPAFTVMDGVVAMEGNGPGAGEPRRLGVLLASSSPLAVDVAAGALVGLPPVRHPILRVARARGLKPNEPADVSVVGEPLESFDVSAWAWPPTAAGAGGFVGYGPFAGVIAGLLRHGLSVQPAVVRDKCTGCGLCRETCPVGAIEVINNKSHIEEKLCIRCYCCHEACAYDAIKLKRSLLHRLLARAPA